MSRRSIVTGLLLVLLGGGVFLWKTVALELPMLPSEPEGLWQVQLEISARGAGRRGSLRAWLPSPERVQRIFGEQFETGDLRFSIREETSGRQAIWSGRMSDVKRVSYAFRVQVFPARIEIPPDASKQAPPKELASTYTRRDPGLPVDHEAIQTVLETLDLGSGDDLAARARTIYSFVVHEVTLSPSAADDALIALADRRGNRHGKERLLCTLLRAAKVPARIVQGLELLSGDALPRRWVEIWLGGHWIPASAGDDFFGRMPPDRLLLGRGDAPLVEATGVEAVSHSFHAIPERLTPQELAALMVPPDPTLEALSLYGLSVPMQAAVRVLLLLPLGVLITAFLRNVVGIPSFGTFMPLLVALALRGTGLGTGLALLGGVLLIGILVRMLLERLRLLLVPRLSLILCVVVLSVISMGLLGLRLENRDFYAGILFPIVILTMLIERFSVTAAESNVTEAVRRSLYSTLIAVIIYPVLRSSLAEHLMFGFPELVIVIMGLLVMMGGYTGYRLTELYRFRSLTGGS
jgi:transglutaminase-like putative cysteine protease